ncbi:MAG: protoporphyrinogen oxidase [Pirellulales bacterium]
MNAPTSARRRIAVIGGGISGLAAAYYLTRAEPAAEPVLLEASDRVGGVLQTVHRDGFLIERSADNFLTRLPAAVDLCREVGLAEELIETEPRFRRAFVVHGGRLRRVPAGFLLSAPRRLWPMITTPLLSPRGKLRLMRELRVPPRREDSDESVASFVRRRFGSELYERLAQPLLGGIYTADAEMLSMQATLPQLVEDERQFGSLLRAARRRAGQSPGEASERGARYSLFVAPRRGMSSLVEAVAARLPEAAIHTSHRVTGIALETAGQWRVDCEATGGTAGAFAPLLCDGVILATGSRPAARLLGAVDPQLAAELSGIPSASSAVVSLGFRREQIQHPLDGFGFVVPAVEGRRIIAGSFASVKFPGRAPDGCVLVRVFIGGALQQELVEAPDDALIEIAAAELAELIGASGSPLLCDVARWGEAMPQYHVGHLERLARIEERLRALPRLALAGNAYRGVGIPQCVESGKIAAEHVLAQI